MFDKCISNNWSENTYVCAFSHIFTVMDILKFNFPFTTKAIKHLAYVFLLSHLTVIKVENLLYCMFTYLCRRKSRNYYSENLIKIRA